MAVSEPIPKIFIYREPIPTIYIYREPIPTISIYREPIPTIFIYREPIRRDLYVGNLYDEIIAKSFVLEPHLDVVLLRDVYSHGYTLGELRRHPAVVFIPSAACWIHTVSVVTMSMAAMWPTGTCLIRNFSTSCTRCPSQSSFLLLPH